MTWCRCRVLASSAMWSATGLLWALTACASTSAPEQLAEEAAAKGLAPWPYTADQIRGSHPEGTTLFFDTTGWDVPPTSERMTFTEVSEEHATIESVVTNDDGDTVGEPQSGTSTWRELRNHASFPADRTERVRVTRETPLGTHECWRYIVTGEDEMVRTFDFADELPGPPIYWEGVLHGEVVITSMMVGRVVP